jgi:hypothetical protein
MTDTKKIRQLLTAIPLCALPGASSIAADGSGDDNVSCYQDGQLIFRTKDRLRAFTPANAMQPLADISVGQIQERVVTLYGAGPDGLVCVVTMRK